MLLFLCTHPSLSLSFSLTTYLLIIIPNIIPICLSIYVDIPNFLFLLQAVTFEWAPSVFYYRSRNGSVLFRYGTDIGVLETLAQVLNFTVEYQEPPKGQSRVQIKSDAVKLNIQ